MSKKQIVVIAGIILIAVAAAFGVSLWPRIQSDFYVRQGQSQGTSQAALNDYARAIELDPGNAQAYVHRGILYNTILRDWGSALADFDKAIALDPSHAFAYQQRGFANEKLGNLDAAHADYTRAIELEPRDSVSYLGRAGINEEWGHTQEAIDDYLKFLSLYQKDDDTSRHFQKRVVELSAQLP
jgi:lipoprotein NlpI